MAYPVESSGSIEKKRERNSKVVFVVDNKIIKGDPGVIGGGGVKTGLCDNLAKTMCR